MARRIDVLIPIPEKIERGVGAFRISRDTVLRLSPVDARLREISEILAEPIRDATGFPLPYRSLPEAQGNEIGLELHKNLDRLGDEGYQLEITTDSTVVRACKAAGIFYGLQTLRQLLRHAPEYRSTGEHNGEWTISAMRIEDRPRFPWRGMLLDVSRHFVSPETVKRTIDLLAQHKMNRFHWHLTDDQGWRLEIDRYPRLTSVGGWRRDPDGRRYGGFYTKDEVREIVDFASRRHVTIVPEIEMPGHSVAALAAYPEHSCTGGPFEVEPRWGIFQDVYCAGNDATFAFLEAVLDEVIDLFPGRFIHIGGDECPRDRWRACPRCQKRIREEGLPDEDALQSYFIRSVARFLRGRGRRVIGWDEVIEGGLTPGIIVQSWRGMDGAVTAARHGNDAIVSPTSHAYFDYGVDKTNLEKVYSFNPMPDALSTHEVPHLLGGACNLWTERITEETLDSMLFPRVLAMAERLWSPRDSKDWEGFHRRVRAYYPRLDAMGVTYGKECEDG